MDSFEEFLKDNRYKHLCVISPGGNHGDTMIHLGLIKKLEEYSIKYTYLNLQELYRQNLLLGAKYIINIGLWRMDSDLGFDLLELPKETELILFEGGGYMNDIWYGPTLLRQIMKRNAEPIAIGPQSYLFKRTKFHKYFDDGRPVYLFYREKYSFEYLKNMGLPSNVISLVSPELALYLDRDDLRDVIEERAGGYELIAMRRDKESSISTLTKKEIVRRCENPLISDISVEKTFTDFVSKVHNAKEVFTDRLHVAILSKILGKKSTLFGNSYHKNRGVWEYSLKDYIDYVEIK
jgi:exopolysaccharide biosynthesis predicted pyruvyltransferase EpsI